MKILEESSLVSYNTFGMDVTCQQLIVLEHPNEILQAAHDGLFDGHWFILGGGSNVLFTRNFEGTIFHPVFKGITVEESNHENTLLSVAAGVKWDEFTDYCLHNQLYGVENLTGIPGYVGSAPVQNIGAYGVEVKECIECVKGYRLDTLQPFQLSNADCQFGYRDSIFKNELKGKCFITEVYFRLSRKPIFNLSYKALSNALTEKGLEPSIENIAHTVTAIRNSKLPDIRTIGCAGSFFKNPIVSQTTFLQLTKRIPDLVSYPTDNQQVKLAAGQLIDKAGWKGKQIGNAGIWNKQALVVVNFGGAKPEEICTIYKQVIFDVKQQFGIELQPEVNIL